MSDERSRESEQRHRPVLDYRGRPEPLSPEPRTVHDGLSFKWGSGLALAGGTFAGLAALGKDGRGIACSVLGALVLGVMVGIFDLLHARHGRFLLGFIAGEVIVVGIGFAILPAICGK